MRMIFQIITVVCLSGSVVAQAESEAELKNTAITRVTKMMHDVNSEYFRDQLLGKGIDAAGVELMLSEAFETAAVCLVEAATDQASEQELPLEQVLAIVGGEPLESEGEEVAQLLDTNALNQKSSPCNKALGQALGLKVR